MNIRFMLAPIENMTSNAFRTICHKYGADLTFTELARIEALAKKNKCTLSRTKLKDETPTIIQLLGGNEKSYKKFLSDFEPSKGFQGFNLNLGCPSLHVINLGVGCAMVRRINKTKKIVNIVRDAGYPVSIKMRLGINEKDKERKVYLNLINAVDADFFVVHARHGTQNCNEPADFNVYEECVKTGREIIANGDIKNKEQIEFLKGVGVKGAMIGRAAILDPTVFNRLKGLPCPDKKVLINEYLELAKKFDEPELYKKNILRTFENLTQDMTMKKIGSLQ